MNLRGYAFRLNDLTYPFHLCFTSSQILVAYKGVLHTTLFFNQTFASGVKLQTVVF